LETGKKQEYFVYVSPLIALGAFAGIAATVNLQIQADAPFLANYMTVTVLQANVVVANFGGTLQVTDSAVGRTLFNDPIPVDAIRGNGGLPYPFNPPRLFSMNSTLVITATNSAAAAATLLYVSFHGNKIYSDYNLEV
jgi:hypothetical protein